MNSPLLSFEERERDAAALKMIARDRAGCSKKPSVKSLKLRDLASLNVKFRASGGAPWAGEAVKSGLLQTQVFLFILIGIQSHLQ